LELRLLLAPCRRTLYRFSPHRMWLNDLVKEHGNDPRWILTSFFPPWLLIAVILWPRAFP